MRKIYYTVGNFIFKGKNKDSKDEAYMTDVKMIKEFMFDESTYLYIQSATYEDAIETIVNKYKKIDIEMKIPTIELSYDGMGEDKIDSKYYKNMTMIYKDIFYFYKNPSDLIMIFSDDEKIDMSKINFILNNIKEINKEIELRKDEINKYTIEEHISKIDCDKVNISSGKKYKSKIKSGENKKLCSNKINMNIDFKEEILENEYINICGNAEMIKQLLFDVTGEVEGFELSSNVSIYSKYLTLTRINNILYIEDIQDEEGNFIPQETEMLWLDKDILNEAKEKKQESAFLEWRYIVSIY